MSMIHFSGSVEDLEKVDQCIHDPVTHQATHLRCILYIFSFIIIDSLSINISMGVHYCLSVSFLRFGRHDNNYSPKYLRLT